MAAVGTGKGTVLLRVGGRFGEMQLLGLRADRAFLLGKRDSTCFLPLYGHAQRPDRERADRSRTAKATKPRAGRAKARPTFEQAELVASIRPLGGDRYAISRAFLDDALGKLAGARGLGRFVAAQEDGRQIGLKVYGVRRGSLLARLGIRNGDVLRALNGIALTSTDGIFDAFSLMRQQSHFSVALLRSREPRTLEYVAD